MIASDVLALIEMEVHSYSIFEIVVWCLSELFVEWFELSEVGFELF